VGVARRRLPIGHLSSHVSHVTSTVRGEQTPQGVE
jgi:hypothetical protein